MHLLGMSGGWNARKVGAALAGPGRTFELRGRNLNINT
jgi:hypothetical protein